MAKPVEEVAALARLVLKLGEAREVLEREGPRIASRNDAPFLHRQLDAILDELDQALSRISVQREDGGNGLFGRLFGSGPGHSDEEPLPHAQLMGLANAIPVTDLVSFLSQSRKTGILWVFGKRETFLVELVDGRLVHATSDRTPRGMLLGELLVRHGLMTKKEVRRWVKRAREAGQVLGSHLVEQGRISAEELRSVLAEQIQDLFHRLSNEQNALYRFHEGDPLQCAAGLDLNVTSLLLESARNSDETRRDAA